MFDDQDLSRISQQGLDLYREKLKAILETDHNGRTVAIHNDSGEYAIAENSPEARRALRVRQPHGSIVTMLIGPNQMDQLARRMLGGQIAAARHVQLSSTSRQVPCP